jgi:putative hemolysin
MTSTEYILLLGVMPTMLICSGIVSGSETALFGLTQADRVSIKKNSPRAFSFVEALHRKPRSLLTAILLANMLINVSYFTLSSIVILGLEDRQQHLASILVGIGSLVAIVLFGEVIAKTTASAHRPAFCRLTAPFWLLVIQYLWPVWSVIDRFVMAPLTRLITAKPSSGPGLDQTELQHILSTPGEEQHIDADEQRLLLDVLRLGTLRARDVMTPRVNLLTLQANSSPDVVVSTIRKHRPDQILVIDEDEAPLGFLRSVKYLKSHESAQQVSILDEMTKPLYVPEQTKLDSVLSQLRQKGQDRAAVVDERGELVGVIRVEDVVAELIDDAAGHVADGDVQMLGLGKFRVPGKMSARTLLRDFDGSHAGSDALLGKVSTIAGVLLTLLGKLPERGDSVTLGSLVLTVSALDGRVIETIDIELMDQQSEADS